MEYMKVYHKHGFLLKKRFGKKLVDLEGVANSKQTILEMGGNPDKWHHVIAGWEIAKENREWSK